MAEVPGRGRPGPTYTRLWVLTVPGRLRARNGWDQQGREVIVEHLRVVRAIGAGRRTWGSAFLFIVQKTKRSTTCPT